MSSYRNVKFVIPITLATRIILYLYVNNSQQIIGNLYISNAYLLSIYIQVVYMDIVYLYIYYIHVCVYV